MRVGIVTTWYPRGAAYVSQQYARALEPAHELFIFARGGERPAASDTEWHGPNVHWGREPVIDAGPTSLDLGDFADWLDRERIACVIFNEQWWLEPLLVCARKGVRTVAYLVEYRTEQLPLYDAFDLLIAHTRQQHATFAGRHPGTHYVPWGTDLAYFRPETLEPAEAGAVTFVHSAGLNADRKGTDLVVTAFARLHDEGVHHARLRLHSQGAIRAKLDEKRLARLEKAGVLAYRGPDAPDPSARAPMTERRDLYLHGDVYVYPSRFDGLGLSVPEASACGLWCLTTDAPPMNEFMADGNGRTIAIARSYASGRAHHPFVEPSIDALVDRMRECARDFGASWKRSARDFADANFDWMRNARDFPSIVASGASQDAHVKAAALEAVRLYEAARRTTLRAQVAYRWPWVVRTARGVARGFARAFRASPARGDDRFGG